MVGQRVTVVASGVALGALGGLVFAFDPTSPGSRFPACIFHRTTGLWCPACGLTRGTHELLHGHLATALGLNVFTPLALVAIVAGWWAWARRAWTGRPIGPPWMATVPRVVEWSIVGALVVYLVLRNIPIAPLNSLAP